MLAGLAVATGKEGVALDVGEAAALHPVALGAADDQNSFSFQGAQHGGMDQRLVVDMLVQFGRIQDSVQKQGFAKGFGLNNGGMLIRSTPFEEYFLKGKPCQQTGLHRFKVYVSSGASFQEGRHRFRSHEAWFSFYPED